jgi:hypothetical protein
MTTITGGVRRTIIAVAAVAALCLALAGTPTAQAHQTRAHETRAHETRAAAQTKTTVLTVRIRSCEGCEVTLISYLDSYDNGWSSDPHTIAGGQAAFVVPTARTAGLSAMVRTPWEGNTGYVTMVVFRYRGLAVGDRIGFNRARTMTKASGCWAGTTAKQASLRIKVRRITVQGNGGKVPGNIAWTPTTQAWLRPMLPAYRGVLGAQDVILCKS